MTKKVEVIESAENKPNDADAVFENADKTAESKSVAKSGGKAKAAENQGSFSYKGHTVDFGDPGNVNVYGGSVRANLGDVDAEAAKAWIDEFESANQ